MPILRRGRIAAAGNLDHNLPPLADLRREGGWDVTERKPLEHYLDREYPLRVVAEAGGGCVILFPDLPGCLTQVESLAEVGPMAEEIKTLWIETAYERGMEIPSPSYSEEYSGKFNVRIPHSPSRPRRAGD